MSDFSSNAPSRGLVKNLGLVFDGGSYGVFVAESYRGIALYCLANKGRSSSGSVSWSRPSGRCRETLSEFLRDFGGFPGLAVIVGRLPDDPALASRVYWRGKAEDREVWIGLEQGAAAEAARYRALEAAAILERGLLL